MDILTNDGMKTLFQPLINNGKLRYLTWQLELGQQLTPHLQMYFEFNQPIRRSQIYKILGSGHLEPRRGTREQARDYCQKEETRLDGPWTLGTWNEVGQGCRTDLLHVQKLIQQGESELYIANNNFNTWVRNYKALREYRRILSPNRNWMPVVHVVLGPTGTGKSRWAMQVLPDAYWKQRSIWWDGYEGHEGVVLDEFYGWIPFDVLLRICDRYPLLVETKGGQCNFLAKTIVITSNKLPHDWYNNVYFDSFKRRVAHWHVMPTLGQHQTFEKYEEAIKLVKISNF